jgi:hypothetical protein
MLNVVMLSVVMLSVVGPSLLPNVSLSNTFLWFLSYLKRTFQQTLWMNSFIFKVICQMLDWLINRKKYICKYIKINKWSHAQIIFHRRPTSRGVLNNDPLIWIGGARPSQKVLLNNFKLKLNLSFASMKNSCPPKKWQSHCQHK